MIYVTKTRLVVGITLLVLTIVLAYSFNNVKDNPQFDVVLIEGKNLTDAMTSAKELTIEGKPYKINKSQIVSAANLAVVLNGYVGDGAEKCINKVVDLVSKDSIGVLINNLGVLELDRSISKARDQYLKTIAEEGTSAGHIAGRVYSDELLVIFSNSDYKFTYMNDIAECSEAIKKYIDKKA
ncbi:hypothetical protein D0815_23250 [Vibrio parahaemolyticus]|nr:hypothetical protein [Vibrio parahaemolyticus]MBM4910183.1 hypothetical protein [Vibrio parahaemolyticus]MBM5032347.1 hypothetical protein [Vibrio parahaemolyticus]MBM5096486.1 hypothetical protein [Vibrio parahaemolyticus]MBM5419223.1 hypothetical protein [Vibrio parahaemolyticus]